MNNEEVLEANAGEIEADERRAEEIDDAECYGAEHWG
jgi:hypothetical protein